MMENKYYITLIQRYRIIKSKISPQESNIILIPQLSCQRKYVFLSFTLGLCFMVLECAPTASSACYRTH